MSPQTLRALVRADEIWLVVLAAVVGVGGGHRGRRDGRDGPADAPAAVPACDRRVPSSQVQVEPLRAVLVPASAAWSLGVAGILVARSEHKPRRRPDRGERALRRPHVAERQPDRGGADHCRTASAPRSGSRPAIPRSARPWPRGSAARSGCGATTCACWSAAAPRARSRPRSMRPLTGAFYAFELVIGTYRWARSRRWSWPRSPRCRGAPGRRRRCGFDIRVPTAIEAIDYVPILALGVFCALVGILIMRGVTIIEDAVPRSRVPAWLRPAVGRARGRAARPGLRRRCCRPGHAALQPPSTRRYAAATSGRLISAEVAGLGGLHRLRLPRRPVLRLAVPGRAAGQAVRRAARRSSPPCTRYRPCVCALVGMSGMAVAVVGGPLTMAFLALETTAACR